VLESQIVTIVVLIMCGMRKVCGEAAGAVFGSPCLRLGRVAKRVGGLRKFGCWVLSWVRETFGVDAKAA
jgi:hypothetical protein